MVSTVKSLFGGPPKPKVQGPDPELLAAQKRQSKRLERQEVAAEKRERSTRAVIAARGKRGQGVTLNPATGERGVVGGGKLGGS